MNTSNLRWFGIQCFSACYWLLKVADSAHGEYTFWPWWVNVCSLILSVIFAVDFYRKLTKEARHDE